MQPVVMNLDGNPLSEIAFISYATTNDLLFDRGGRLRIIDGNCTEIARFPNLPACPTVPLPANCPATLSTTPQLAPASGLAVGNVDWTPDVEIIAVLGDPTSGAAHKQIIAFNLVGNCLRPKWCSAPLAGNDVIPYASTPALAQLDQPGSFGGWGNWSEIILDNKVYNGFGVLRFSGFSIGGNDCGNGSGAVGGVPCPRSRIIIAANFFGGGLPQLITGRGLYRSNPGGGPLWTGALGWDLLTTAVTQSSQLFPAVADLDVSGTPEILVSDRSVRRLRILSPANGVTLAWVNLPVLVGPCGGPPIVGDMNNDGRPDIGVASCDRYTVYRFAMGGPGTPSGFPGTLTQVWSAQINDQSGMTTSTLGRTPDPVIYYADQANLHVLNAANGNPMQPVIPNTSGTATEGPIIADLNGSGQGRVIVVANAHWLPTGSGIRGVRVFRDPFLGPARNVWNQHAYHVTNVTNSLGVIPVTEQPSWLPISPARNSYRVQQP